ncbi:hypothetical protein [Niallia sp. FSL R7-0271]|uniref:hypothetical protein n=1 Tax=Niallia sp. FSL R7-0271 TaxID=2921678 RepID=UPI0030FAD8B5
MLGFEILTSKNEQDNTCYLCSATLLDYIMSLTEDFMDYNIQRGIVSNVYLDNLVDTVLQKRHIPPITLVVSSYSLKGKQLDVDEYKILDGLQRTYRLKVIWDTVMFLEKYVLTDKVIDFPELSKYQLSRRYGKGLRNFGSTTSILEKLIRFYKEAGLEDLKNCFNVPQWFEIWNNLSPEEEVEKMLILNAGHKPVSLKHQLELLFLNIIPHINEIKQNTGKDIELIRAKASLSSKKRSIGEIYFPHLISSALSFINGAPITTNTGLISEMQEDSTNNYKNYLNYSFLEGLTTFLFELDEYLVSIYGEEEGLQWISRETVSVGLFGALGKYVSLKAENDYYTPENVFLEFMNNLRASQDDILKIRDYNELRANLDLSRVNVGNVTKNAIFKGIFKLANSNFAEPIDWYTCFRGDKDAD